jgi:hypothetical protein
LFILFAMLDCFASLAMTKAEYPLDSNPDIPTSPAVNVTVQRVQEDYDFIDIVKCCSPWDMLDCFASLAMTGGGLAAKWNCCISLWTVTR